MSGVTEGRLAADSFRLNRAGLTAVLASSGVAKELERRALSVERRAKQMCPVDTGRLRASIASALETDSRGLSAVVGTNVVYGIYVELSQPFLRPALAERA